MDLIHATCVSLAGAGVLIRGSSGSGKSDLALRLIDGGALLVADDQVIVEPVGAGLRARAPERLAGHVEVRGLGILPVPHAPDVRLCLVVDLTAPEGVERLPDPMSAEIAGVVLPRIPLAPFQSSACAKVRLAAAAVAAGRLAVPDGFAAVGEGRAHG